MSNFKKYVEDRDSDIESDSLYGMPDNKVRNGLADPDPTELKQPHKPNSRDLDLAKQAVQLIMMRSPKWNLILYKFLRKCGEKIPDVNHLVDNMTRPKELNKLFGREKQPDELSPSSADTPPAYYQP